MSGLVRSEWIRVPDERQDEVERAQDEHEPRPRRANPAPLAAGGLRDGNDARLVAGSLGRLESFFDHPRSHRSDRRWSTEYSAIEIPMITTMPMAAA